VNVHVVRFPPSRESSQSPLHHRSVVVVAVTATEISDDHVNRSPR
jgi:hypothetical protein